MTIARQRFGKHSAVMQSRVGPPLLDSKSPNTDSMATNINKNIPVTTENDKMVTYIRVA
jgi:hypothetical protein